MSYPNDFADDLIRGKKTLPQDLLYKLVLNYQKSIQRTEDDTVSENFIYSPLLDRHNVEISFTPREFNVPDESYSHLDYFTYHKLYNSPLPTHNPVAIPDIDPASYRFANPTTLEGSKFGGGIFPSQTINVTFGNSSHVYNPQTTISFWFYRQPGIIYPFTWLFRSTGIGFSCRVQNAQISFTHQQSNQTAGLGGINLHDGWNHIAITVNLAPISDTQFARFTDLYLDGVRMGGLNGSPAGNPNIDLASSRFILNMTGGNYGFAWLSISNIVQPANWIVDAYNGMLDYTNSQELLCLPFVQDIKELPIQSSGLYST